MNNSPFIYPSTLNIGAILPQVLNYAALPAASLNNDQFYYVQQTTGLWFFNRYSLGIYKSNGSAWEYTGNADELTATSSQDGYLKSSDWISFNSKQQVYFSYPVAGNVVENDIVKNAVNQLNGQAPLNFVLASADADYWAIIGVAKNVNNGTADIYVSGRVTGFSFGAFVGVEYYIDPANPGKITWTPPSIADPIKIGRALDATSLILTPHQQRQFVQAKGGIYTSDGHWDDVIAPGTNGAVLTANSAQTLGLQFLPAVVASAPFTYTTATRALTIAVATNAVAGVLSAADHTTYSGYAATIALKAPLASPVLTGDVTASTGNVIINAVGKGLQVKSGVNAKVGLAVLITGVAIVVNTSVTANSIILLTGQIDGGTVGSVRCSSKTVGVGFTITSTSLLDTSTIGWVIIEKL